MTVEIKTIKPIVDPSNGQTVIETGTVGTVNGFEVDPGPNAFIPSNGVKSFTFDRRIKFDCQFNNGNYFLIVNEDFIFVTPWGLLKVLMESKQIISIDNPTPVPAFVTDVVEPFGITFTIEGGLKVTLLTDRVSGSLDVQLESTE